MRKILLSFFNCLLVAFVVGLSSCKDNTSPGGEPVKVDITQSATDIAVGGTGASIVLRSNDFMTKSQQVSASFSAKDLTIHYGSESLQPGRAYDLSVSTGVTLNVVGLSIGEHTVIITVSENGISSQVKVNINVRAKLYEMVLVNEESKQRQCGKRMGYDFRIIDAENPGAINANYKVSARVIKGRGVVQMMSNEVLWNDTIPNYVPQSCIVPNEKWGGLYTGYTIGENQVEFTIEDSKNNIMNITQTFIIDSSRFTLFDIVGIVPAPLRDTIEQHGTGRSYYFHINNNANFDNRFFVSVEWSSPYAKEVIVDGQSLKPGEWSTVPIKGGLASNTSQTVGVTLVNPGVGGVTYDATIIIKDLWGQTQRLPVGYHVRGSDYTTKVEYEKSAVQFGTTQLRTFISDFADDVYAEFTYRYLPVAGYDCSGMKFYERVENNIPVWQSMSTPYIFKSHTTNESGSTRFAELWSYISFTTSGTKVFDLEITNRFGVTRLFRQSITITPNVLASKLDKSSYTAIVGEEHTVMKPTVAITQQSVNLVATLTYRLLSGNGEFQADDKPMVSGSSRTYEKVSDIRAFYFYPAVSGRHEVEMTVSVPDGRTTVMRTFIDATYPAMKFAVNGAIMTVVQGEVREMGISASQGGHNELIRWKYRMIEGEGVLTNRVTGAVIPAGTLQSMVQTTPDKPILIDFVSTSYAGNVKMEFTAIDKDGVEVDRTTAFVVTASNLSLDFPEIPLTVGLFDKLNFDMKITKPHYTGNITVNYKLLTTSSGYTGRGTFDLANGSIIKVGQTSHVFTPSAAGRTQVTFTITDEHGNSAVKIMTFEVIPPKLSLTMSVPAHTAAQPNGGESSFTFTIAEENHSEDFEFEFSFNQALSSITLERHPIYLDGVRIYDGGVYPLKAGTYTFKEVNNAVKVNNPDDPSEFSLLQGVKLSLIVRDKHGKIVKTESYCLPKLN